jgi:hypothetical protein
MMLNDMQQVPIANHNGSQHAASGYQMVAQGADYATRNVHQRHPSGVQDSADGNRVMVQHDGRAHYNADTPIAHYNDNTPIAHYNVDTPIAHYNDNTPIAHYNDNTPITHYNADTPIPHYNTDTPITHYNADTPIAHYNADTPIAHYNAERASHTNVRAYPAVEQRRAEMEHQASGYRALSGVQHSAGQRPSMPYAPYTTTPAPKTTPMSYGNEAHTARHPVAAYTTDDIMPMMPVTTPIAHGSQSSAMPSQHIPAQHTQCTLVKDKVAALETHINIFGQDTTKGPTVFLLSSLDDGDSADWHQTNQHSPRSLDAHKGHDKAYSKALSSSGSGVSQSLDGHKNDRDMARNAVEIAQAKERTAQAIEETKQAEMHLLKMDASVGLSRRSRNSSEASSVQSEGQSAVSSSHRS